MNEASCLYCFVGICTKFHEISDFEIQVKNNINITFFTNESNNFEITTIETTNDGSNNNNENYNSTRLWQTIDIIINIRSLLLLLLFLL